MSVAYFIAVPEGSKRNVVSISSFPAAVGIRVFCGFPQPPSRSASAEKIVPVCFLNVMGTAAGAVVTVGKPERVLRRLFQAACGNHQEEAAEGPPISDFHQLRQFPPR